MISQDWDRQQESFQRLLPVPFLSSANLAELLSFNSFVPIGGSERNTPDILRTVKRNAEL